MSNYMKVMGKQVPETYTECLHKLVGDFMFLTRMMGRKDEYKEYDELVEVIVDSIVETMQLTNQCDDRITTYTHNTIPYTREHLMQIMKEGF